MSDSDIFISISEARCNDTIVYQYQLSDQDRLDSQTGDKVFECFECNQKLSVCRRKNIVYFSHLPNSKDCILKQELSADEKQKIKLMSEYRSSGKHSKYQDKIIRVLSKKGFQNIQKEKKYYKNGKLVHSADVYFEYAPEKFVIEVQISSLPLKHITKRINFYREQKTYLMWVVDFNHVNQKQFIKDIKYTAYTQEFFSVSDDSLYVNYKDLWYDEKNNAIKGKWKKQELRKGSLKYNEKDFGIYYFDSKLEKSKLYEQYPKLYLNELDRLDEDKLLTLLEARNNNFISALFQWRKAKYDDIFVYLLERKMYKVLKIISHQQLRFLKDKKLFYTFNEHLDLFFEDELGNDLRRSLMYCYFDDIDVIENICAIKSVFATKKDEVFINYVNGHTTLTDLTMQILRDRPKYSKWFIEALKRNGYYDNFIERPKFKALINKQKTILGETNINSLFIQLFPELENEVTFRIE